MGNRFLVALDQGTTSTRAIVYDAASLTARFTSQHEFPQHYPQNGWVEHDVEDIWSDVRKVLAAARDYVEAQSGLIEALGITNQRETVVLWDKKTGKPLANAIVWQDRRTADRCEQLASEGAFELVNSRTGLVLDPYFSSTKLAWLLDRTGSRDRAAAGEVLAGTIDAFLVWRLTGGARHATDVTNASRTQLFSLAAMDWDPDLLALHDIPRACLPEVLDCTAHFGDTAEFGGTVPICGIAGDQQAAAIGQACLEPGAVKSTYGTGCFVIAQSGPDPIVPGGGLLGTVGYRAAGRTSYAVEGSIFVAGAAVQWLRDKAGLLATAAESEELARQAKSAEGLYLVPAFTGLGAPHWKPNVRGALFGATLDTDRAALVKATLEAVAYQTADLFAAFESESVVPKLVNIDGGMSRNDWFAQFLCDIIACAVSRPQNIETTATGAAFLAGLQAGVYSSLDDIGKLRQEDRSFSPAMEDSERGKRLAGWQSAVNAAMAFEA